MGISTFLFTGYHALRLATLDTAGTPGNTFGEKERITAKASESAL